MTDIARALEEIRARIAAAERRFGRAPGSVFLLAVSKGHSATAVQAALAAGQRRFGESYASEAVPKIESLAGQPIEWHYIGPIQSNKTRTIAAHFDWVHSIDRLKIAQRLSDQRQSAQPPLDVCIQVNVSGEDSKSGVPPAEAAPLAQAVAQLPRLRVRGLMAIPSASDDFDEQRAAFRRLHEIRDALAADGLVLDTLSMGMTTDLEAAIAEGATIVRIGTGIFGERIRP